METAIESAETTWRDGEPQEARHVEQTAPRGSPEGSVSHQKSCVREPNYLILTALQRELPNMKIVTLLVEKFKVDITCLYIYETRVGSANRCKYTDSVLHLAARGNNWWHVSQAMPYLLKIGTDVDIRDDAGRTPLHRALSREGTGPYYKEAAEILIEAGADVNAVDNDGMDCLAHASHDPNLVRLLKKHGGVVQAHTLFTCIGRWNAPALEVLLAGGADPNMRLAPSERCLDLPREVETHQVSPLYHAAGGSDNYAIDSSQVKMVQLLLDYGADPFATFRRKVENNYEERTVLHEIFGIGQVAEAMLRIPGLDVNRRDAEGRTLLHVACAGFPGPEYLISGAESRNESPSNQVTLFQRLVSLGADVKAQDNEGRNALHHMIGSWRNDGLAAFEKTLTALCNMEPGLLTMVDSAGRTPLHQAITRAISYHTADVAELLIKLGADPHAVDKAGNNLVHILAQNLYFEELRTFLEVLVSLGVDVNGRNELGETPLFRFCDPPFDIFIPTAWEKEKGMRALEYELVGMLKRLGVDFVAKDARGRGVLHLAARGDVDRFKALMSMGLDVMMEDDAQQAPVDVAAACGNTEVLALFEKKN
jgi:ankyrin repeat protein